MSELNHSSEEVQNNPTTESVTIETALPPATSGRSWKSYLAGTVVLLVLAAVCLQFFQANPAVSQTDGTDANTGRVTMNAATPGKILAKVNNQGITYDLVARECVAKYGEEILESMVNRLIIQQECDRLGITVSRGEVEAEVAETAKKFNLPLDTWYQMLSSERGLTKEQYQNDIIWPMLALKKLAGKDIQVTEKEMQEGFERDYGPRVKARMILVEGNIRQANQIWEKCMATPDDFDRIARENSADPNSRPLGGVIPPIRKNGVDKAIEEAAFKLQPGELSGLIQVSEGRYVILKCEGLTEPVVEDIRVVWNDLLAQLTEEKTQTSVAKVFEKLRKEARVDNFLTRTSTAGRNPIQQTAGFTNGEPVKPQVQQITR
ncbi:peptidylprolyl isomerase [Thalassoglobus polymorphus]|uniref:peptidylprolyl isomerase n=1 Tax=Thalassoglobus polymorphus TaxID=2527994 RepID=A0A517QHQ3_9PLAN|nr:peptidylprolyl isomerase [Thalassoglobus polymorphus]QDT31162.1 Foldase protein PrsA 3 precursor [Thalassoglobus polymorphus]